MKNSMALILKNGAHHLPNITALIIWRGEPLFTTPLLCCIFYGLYHCTKWAVWCCCCCASCCFSRHRLENSTIYLNDFKNIEMFRFVGNRTHPIVLRNAHIHNAYLLPTVKRKLSPTKKNPNELLSVCFSHSKSFQCFFFFFWKCIYSVFLIKYDHKEL